MFLLNLILLVPSHCDNFKNVCLRINGIWERCLSMEFHALKTKVIWGSIKKNQDIKWTPNMHNQLNVTPSGMIVQCSARHCMLWSCSISKSHSQRDLRTHIGHRGWQRVSPGSAAPWSSELVSACGACEDKRRAPAQNTNPTPSREIFYSKKETCL